MIIKSIEIDNFGCFSNYKLDLNNGFNLIYGINGKGKSTLMAFIKMMFYSKCGNEKSTDLLKNPRKKYQPFNGSAMSGALVFEHGGYEYRLYKAFGKSPSSDVIELQNTTTGNIETLSAVYDAGNRFFGMSAAEFERSIFIDCGGGFAVETQGFGIESRIENLALTGDEDISRSTVPDRLTAATEELISKSGKKGLIVALEEEISILQNKKNLLLTQINEQSALDKQISILESEIESDEDELENAGKIDKIQILQSELNAYNFLSERLCSLRAVNEKLNEVEPLPISHSRLRRAKLEHRSFMFFSLALIFAILSLSGLFWDKRLYFLAVVGIIFLIPAISAKVKLLLLKKMQESDAKKLHYETAELIRRDISTIAETSGISEEIAFDPSEVEQKIALISKQIEHNSSVIVQSTSSVSRESIHQKHIRLNSLYLRRVLPDGDINEITKLIAEKNKKLKELRSRYESLRIASEVIEDALQETSHELGAFLSQRTGEYLRALNAGKYCDALVSETLDVSLKNQTETRYIPWKHLSRGYIDRTYFALRMATADARLNGNDIFPLFLDDILSQYDEESLERALLVLKNRSQTYSCQILFFTCHNNVKELTKEVFKNFGEIYI